ncbi:MAG: tetratricopeptide repeat protein [Polyangiales bacterium]
MLVLGLALGVFKLWMLFDASRRRVPALWYLALLAPLGELVYFFKVKLPQFDPPPPARISSPPGLLDLEREVERSPSFRNRVRFGWALLDAHQPERAKPYFERALDSHDGDKDASFGLGLCLLELGDAGAAADVLQPLMDRSLAYQDYDAALALIEALFRADRSDRGLELLVAVIRDSGRLDHRLLLARYQLRAQDRTRALDTLRVALRVFEAQAEPERRRDGAVATEARRLLRTLEQQPG